MSKPDATVGPDVRAYVHARLSDPETWARAFLVYEIRNLVGRYFGVSPWDVSITATGFVVVPESAEKDAMICQILALLPEH